MNINALKRNLERAEKYLNIVRRIKSGECTIEEFENIQANAGILQKEMQRLGHGNIYYRRPFGMGIFPNYPIIANFPIMLVTRGLRDEAYNLIPAVEQTLLTYIHEIKELIENPEELKKAIVKNDFYEIIKDIEKNFRKIVKVDPESEKNVQDYLETFLDVKEYEFLREKENIEFSEKTFFPDFTQKELSIAVEVKFLDKKEKKKQIIEEMSADIKPYSKKWKNILFLVYDKGGNIRDVDAFVKDLNQDEDVIIRCIVIKH
ncbi:MAG: hypothetical protein ACFE75_04555 [Candidatus Hodarchaeota archaeon]